MARTLKEIRNSIDIQIMNMPELVAAMSLDVNKTFDEQVSSTNIVKLLMDIVAAGIYFHEQVFDRNKSEITTLLETKKPHQIKWYRDKALHFQYRQETEFWEAGERDLLPDSDEFDNEDIPGADPEKVIEQEKIVKYAAVVEKGGKLFIKVAKGREGAREPLTSGEREALESYFNKIKDAGVVVEVINRKADEFSIYMDIYYDPMIMDQYGMYRDGREDDPVRNTIRKFVQNLPFDGVYKNAVLVDELQKIPGVVIPELRFAESRYGSNAWKEIITKIQPDSGYFKVYEGEDRTKGLILNFKAYETNNELS